MVADLRATSGKRGGADSGSVVVGGSFRRAKYRAWMRLGGSPLALPLLRLYGLLKGSRIETVNRDTEIVVEGFPRSANTHLVAAFRLAQPRHVHIAHHVHGAAQVTTGVRRGLPTILLLRDPVDAVTSLLIRYPFVDPSDALHSYAEFHRPLLPILGGVVVARFADVVADVDTVIERVNRRFEQSFGLLRDSQYGDDAVRNAVEEMDRADRGAESVSEDTVARPSVHREELKRVVRDRVCSPALHERLDIAGKLHDDILSSSTS